MIKSIELKNLRSLQSYLLKVESPTVVIEGPNGIGKTTILEGIYFAATTKSHRTHQEKEMIMQGKPFGLVRIERASARHEVIMTESGKSTLYNKREIKKLSHYIGKMHVVMFSPEDLSLVKGAPSLRRYFMDLEIMQVSQKYLQLLSQYKKILKQRNALLKKIQVDDAYTFLNILGEQLYDVGIQIYDLRASFIQSLNETLQKSYETYEHFKVEIVYEPDVTKAQWLKILKTKQKQDILYQQTLSGIHKDDFKILYNGLLAKDYASQGTIRLIAIELKLALLEWIKQETKQKVILLLDDVLSELDQVRQKDFLNRLPKEHQIFITSATPHTYPKHYQIVKLSKETRNGTQ